MGIRKKRGLKMGNEGLYNRYFDNKDFNYGLISFIYDVRKNKVAKQDAYAVIDALHDRDLIPTNTRFEKKTKSKWNTKLIEYLISGISAGKTSQEYLKYLVDVCNYVRIKNTIVVAALFFLSAVFIGLFIYMLLI